MPDIQELRDSGIKIRKKSPEDLVKSVNRKYQDIFGQGELVGLLPSKDTSMMDVEDFMKYLSGNQEQKKTLPLRNPSPQRLAYIEGIKS